MVSNLFSKVWKVFYSQQHQWQFRELRTAQEQIMSVFKRWLIIDLKWGNSISYIKKEYYFYTLEKKLH